ncbi:hypothetical protein JS533_003170 [Bifidobacterium amazonense]|uniref:Uncharacterized protein n=1 Tax=Bifidobacterium amazonense TaxID=2809027 RepID=A0ABS9VT53_9BIFI|nr:hypothetical protein [Bifidobacterium amazonense]MCH9275279.1 hypothetical protein [Bifidobacterium amazonense]
MIWKLFSLFGWRRGSYGPRRREFSDGFGVPGRFPNDRPYGGRYDHVRYDRPQDDPERRMFADGSDPHRSWAMRDGRMAAGPHDPHGSPGPRQL